MLELLMSLAYFYLNREIEEDTLVPKVHYRFAALFFWSAHSSLNEVAKGKIIFILYFVYMLFPFYTLD
jgi:hypothetical protein